ncbi:MAG: substrate-binding domain-containing protein, partial [Lentisphaeria bacterium]|nr:substrate-binding domain-containing protein [Lentisphaeria bacterium]
TAWVGDGIIAMLETPDHIKLAHALKVPLVNLASSIQAVGVPTVTVDNHHAGRMAARHLIDRGFRRFGFYGMRDVWYSRERCRGFSGALQGAGFSCEVCESDGVSTRYPWDWNRQQLETWLTGLQTPVGILAAHDYRARMVIELCGRLDLNVPNDISIIGIDDDPIVCEHSNPALTSIRQDGYQVGFRAAEMLDRLMSGQAIEQPPRHISGMTLIERESTRTIAVDDPLLRKAIEWIEHRADQHLDVASLVSKLAVSRRWLERAFRKHLHCTPHERICETRVEHAKIALSVVPRLKLFEVAERCGFSDVRRLNVVFERTTGQSIGEYRTAQED